MFLHVSVILSTGGVGFPACITGHMTSLRQEGLPAQGVCLQGGLHPGDLPMGMSACGLEVGQGVCIRRGLHPGGLHSGGSASKGVGQTPTLEKGAVCILLEYFLVALIFCYSDCWKTLTLNPCHLLNHHIIKRIKYLLLKTMQFKLDPIMKLWSDQIRIQVDLIY